MRPAVQIRSLSWSREWDTERLGPEVEIFAFGMADADLGELTVIASQLPDHIVLLTGYDSFELLVRSLHEGKTGIGLCLWKLNLMKCIEDVVCVNRDDCRIYFGSSIT